MLEGVIEGLVGGVLAVAAVVLGHEFLGRAPTDFIVRFQVDTAYLLRWGLLIVLFGGVAGFVGSTLGLRRFLKV